MSNADEVTVVIVPFLAHGHLNQLLHFSLLSTRSGLTVHFASTASHNRQAKHRLQGWPLSSLSSILFHDLPLPPISSPPPNPHSPNSFPTHLQPLFNATDLIRSPLSSLLLSLSAFSRRLIVIHDCLMSLNGFEAAAIPNIESYAFCGPSAAFLCEVEQLMKQGTGLEELMSPEFIRFIERRRNDVVTNSGFIINTCRELESEFLDILVLRKDFLGKPIFAIGPFNPVPMHNSTDISRDECLEWLDGHPPCSVVYVSFGTMSTISDEQAEQLASGLRRSGHRFLWVLRDADRADIFAFESSSRRLSAGFEKAVEGVGKVVRGWVPQLDVLAHRATGGFMSHCGWNSCMEAVSCGVPVMAWPMHSDQPANTRLLAEGLKVGVVVREWDRRQDVVAAERVEEVVRMVMEGEEGRRMREKAREMGEAVRAARKDGASYSTRQRNVKRRRSNRSDREPEPPQPTPPLLPPPLHPLRLSRPLCLLSLPQPPSEAPPPRLAPLLPLLHPLPRPPPSPHPFPSTKSPLPNHLPHPPPTPLRRHRSHPHPLSSLLLSLSASSRRLVVVHDHLMSFAGLEAAVIPNAESYKFYGPSAAFLCEAEQLRMQGTDLDELFSPEFRLFTARRRKYEFKSSGLIINTCREVERNFLEILATREAYSGVPVYAIGPLNPVPRHNKTNSTRNECLEWLDGHPPCSVVYVSFGTTSTISEEQVEQLASGLLRSEHRFLWVLRDADRADIFTTESSSRLVPAGFEKAVEGVGKVVRGWVPQLDVLAHRATGGFMSHCGWNSCMEAMSCGVPVMAWPMHSDQPTNARLLAEGLKVGLVVRGWDRWREVVAAERVEEVVRMVMEGEEGRWMREKAREISKVVRAAGEEGGSSKEALDVLVAHWRR
ncbi:hypothetical protein IEQ34_007820 [Dendrobium chrysotoxum]|uniref:Glycosyltransferase N-terminal domain-containing protein n=1 Tax=Dendrobium chrysotoxum TaxID=161865 RepID=A0AAV7H6M6_DENCH|nr:hypothetical protein IEQ34_007820 [Dendrobium chrysotoxum]